MFRHPFTASELDRAHFVRRAQNVQVFLDKGRESLVDEKNLQTCLSLNEELMISITAAARFSHEFSWAAAT